MSRSSVKPYKKHIFVCTGPRCAPGISELLYQSLKQRLKDLGLHEGENRVQRSQCHCFGICKDGPIAVVYPDGIWYDQLTEEKMERIIQEHLIKDSPVEDYIAGRYSCHPEPFTRHPERSDELEGKLRSASRQRSWRASPRFLPACRTGRAGGRIRPVSGGEGSAC